MTKGKMNKRLKKVVSDQKPKVQTMSNPLLWDTKIARIVLLLLMLLLWLNIFYNINIIFSAERIVYKPVIKVRAQRQAKAEMSISMQCKDWQNSKIA